jgi:predicted AlkP superfamily pyrophosphatase or phosphodiesterase
MTKRLVASLLCVFALSCTAVLLWTSPGATQAAKPSTRPRLVILIIIDQLRNDYLDRFRPYFVEGGFNRLMSGARFTTCRYDYAITATGPGHASIATGAYSNTHGIVENEWYDRALKRPVNCVEDPGTRIVDSAQGPGEKRGASPQFLQGTTLGDELRLASNFQSKVISVSLKDRAAILLGGHTANAAYWYQASTGRFVSSTYYMTALPGWAAVFNDGLPAKDYCGKAWKALDETPGTSGQVFTEYKGKPGEDCPSPRFLSWVDGTPYVSEIELRFAREAVRGEKLGQGPPTETDLLTISLSANDYVGHAKGPYSPQVADMTLRTDRALAGFLTDVDKMVGLSNVWIALSADHGVAPTPEVVKDHRLGPGRFNSRGFREAVEAALSKVLGADNWVESLDLPYIYLNQNTISKHGASSERVEAEAARAAVSVPGVNLAITRSSLLTGSAPDSPMTRKVVNSFNFQRSGDVFIVLDQFAVPSGSETETTHGSPWSYDTQVPLILWGSGFKSGTYVEPCQPIDLVPSIAAALGLNQPSGATGTPLSIALAMK